MGIIARKIIVVPCMVNIALYSAALKKLLSGEANWILNKRASMPPISKKKNAAYPYIIPIFLWSTVVIQLHSPVSEEGLLKILDCFFGSIIFVI